MRVKFTGGREGATASLDFPHLQASLTPRPLVTGTLKGYDQLLNLVMDDIEELLRGARLCSPLETLVDPRSARQTLPQVSHSNPHKPAP